METADIESKKKHPIKKKPLLTKINPNKTTPFRHLPEKLENEPHFFDPRIQRNPYWDADLYGQRFEFRHNFIKTSELFEDHDKVTDSTLSEKLR